VRFLSLGCSSWAAYQKRTRWWNTVWRELPPSLWSWGAALFFSGAVAGGVARTLPRLAWVAAIPLLVLGVVAWLVLSEVFVVDAEP
jgi:hypothetical protein